MSNLRYLFRVPQLARPDRTRLVRGLLCGFFAGLTNPMLMVSVKLVVDTVFAMAEGGERYFRLRIP